MLTIFLYKALSDRGVSLVGGDQVVKIKPGLKRMNLGSDPKWANPIVVFGFFFLVEN